MKHRIVNPEANPAIVTGGEKLLQDLSRLRVAITERLTHTVSAPDLPNVCEQLGLAPMQDTSRDNPWRSKRLYVETRLYFMSKDNLLEIARQVVQAFGPGDLETVILEYTRTGVNGDIKQLIFAADGPKPDIVLTDALSNQIEIVANAEFCLVYDRAISSLHGLQWVHLVEWWIQYSGNPLLSHEVAGRQLYSRLLRSLDSPPERLLFRTYFAKYKERLNGDLPGLVTQVYLHYDPYTVKQLGGVGRLKRQRMDFLLLLPKDQRVILEVDGKQHYSENGLAKPALYGEMVAEDRRLRLAGYEVYRFGGAELSAPEGPTIVGDFFDELLEKHGLLG